METLLVILSDFEDHLSYAKPSKIMHIRRKMQHCGKLLAKIIINIQNK